MTKVLDVGCGNDKQRGAVGIDISLDTQADIIHDLNKFPYPFNNDEFDMVICNDVLEHLENVVAVIEEIHRISKPCAIVRIRIPHFTDSNAYSDVTHKHFFSSQSFDCFINNTSKYKYYTKSRFKILNVRISFSRLYRRTGIEYFANLWPEIYERYFAFIFPAGNIEFELMILK